MSKKLRVNMNFDRDWVEKKGSLYDERPVELIAGSVKAEEKARIIALSYTSLIVEMEENLWDAFEDWLENFVREYFGEENIWKYVQVKGGKKDWKPRLKTEEERKQAEQQDVIKMLRERLVSAGIMDDEVFREMEEMDFNEEDAKESWQEKKNSAERKLTELLKKHEVLSDCPPLKEYLEYIKDMALTMMRMNVSDCLWNKRLLISMESGFGFSTFTQSIYEILEACGIAQRSRSPRNFMEYHISKSGDGSSDVWKKAVSALEVLDESICAGKTTPGVISFDVTEWEDDLDKPEIQAYLRQIADVSTNFLCVFRVSHLEESIVWKIEKAIGQAMPVQSIIVDPPSIEEMAEYLNRKLEGQGFSVTPRKWDSWDLTCDAEKFSEWNSNKPLKLLGQWISEEYKKPFFSGYKSLDNMADRLIYKKAENNLRKHEYSKEISTEDILELLDSPEETGTPWDELNALIGLDDLKQDIRNMVMELKDIADLGQRPSLHMKFVGNPGTGKTTVARIVADIFAYENLLTKGTFRETHARDFCSDIVGRTAIRTNQYCREAYGSVLFIDEAYSLYSDKESRDPGREVINILVKQMEDHRSDFCVIMAGYEEAMNQLNDMNDGLKDRMREVVFKNYKREDLVKIFFCYLDRDMSRMGYVCDKDALHAAVTEFFTSEEKLPEAKRNSSSFSNARYVRNIYERTRSKAICRRSKNGDPVVEIKVEDFIEASEQFVEEEEKKANRIGFY